MNLACDRSLIHDYLLYANRGALLLSELLGKISKYASETVIC